MPDMKDPKYLTTDWLDELKWKADKLRKEAATLTVLADQLDNLSHEFEKRIADHEKWRDKPTKAEKRVARRSEACAGCDGTGRVDGRPDGSPCTVCESTGWKPVSRETTEHD